MRIRELYSDVKKLKRTYENVPQLTILYDDIDNRKAQNKIYRQKLSQFPIKKNNNSPPAKKIKPIATTVAAEPFNFESICFICKHNLNLKCNCLCTNCNKLNRISRLLNCSNFDKSEFCQCNQ